MDGILILDKPGGLTSAGAANRVKRLLPRGQKIGHAGTLDPMATGVLLLLVGGATKRCETMMNHAKGYEATIRLGATTPTDDADSASTAVPSASPRSLDEVQCALRKFVGEISQRPPAFSALKISGQPAYKSARRGKPLDLAPRPIRIDSIEILGYTWPDLKLRVDCGRGTYIRALARDLGEELKTGGYLTALRRTRIGSFDVSDAVTIERLIGDGVAAHLRPISLAHAQDPK